MQPFQIIDNQLFKIISEKALVSERKRSNHNFHELHEVYQRFLNVLTKGTYVQPHKHIAQPKPETFISLKGKLAFFIFNDAGQITEKFILDSNGPIYGIDIQPGVWHSIFCITDVCVCFEGKSGPYEPAFDKEFAAWSPKEGSAEAQNYLLYLNSLLHAN